MTDSSLWARITNVDVSEDGAVFTVDLAGAEIKSPLIPRAKCPALALAMLALAYVDDRAAFQLPGVGLYRLGNLRETGGLLLALVPGDIAEKGIAGIAEAVLAASS